VPRLPSGKRFSLACAHLGMGSRSCGMSLLAKLPGRCKLAGTTAE